MYDYFALPLQLLAFLQGLFTFYHEGYELAHEFEPYKQQLQFNLQNVRVYFQSAAVTQWTRPPYLRPAASDSLSDFKVRRILESSATKYGLLPQTSNSSILETYSGLSPAVNSYIQTFHRQHFGFKKRF